MNQRMIKPHIEKVDLVELAKRIPKQPSLGNKGELLSTQQGTGEETADKEKTPPTQDSTIQLPTTNLQDPETYILLEGTQDYPDMLVQQYRLPLTQEVQQNLQQQNIYNNLLQRAGQKNNQQNPLDPRNYLGHIQHQEALDLTNSLGGFTLPLPQWKDFLKLLKSEKAHNGKGDKVPKEQLTQILNEILEVRSPWRSEWLDAKFTKQADQLYITYNKINTNGTIKRVTEPLEQCLMQDKTPGINLNYWLNNSTSQGLPPKNTSKGDIWYWHPREDRVARFYAGSDVAVLYCGRSPLSSCSSLGVRFARLRATP